MLRESEEDESISEAIRAIKEKYQAELAAAFAASSKSLTRANTLEKTLTQQEKEKEEILRKLVEANALLSQRNNRISELEQQLTSLNERAQEVIAKKNEEIEMYSERMQLIESHIGQQNSDFTEAMAQERAATVDAQEQAAALKLEITSYKKKLSDAKEHFAVSMREAQAELEKRTERLELEKTKAISELTREMNKMSQDYQARFNSEQTEKQKVVQVLQQQLETGLQREIDLQKQFSEAENTIRDQKAAIENFQHEIQKIKASELHSISLQESALSEKAEVERQLNDTQKKLQSWIDLHNQKMQELRAHISELEKEKENLVSSRSDMLDSQSATCQNTQYLQELQNEIKHQKSHICELEKNNALLNEKCLCAWQQIEIANSMLKQHIIDGKFCWSTKHFSSVESQPNALMAFLSGIPETYQPSDADCHTLQNYLEGLIKEGQQLASQYDDLHELVSHLSEAVSDISHLYFTALTISIKLRAMIQFPVTIDVNTLMEEVQQRMVAMADWPRWISDRLFRQSTMEGVGV